jgi:uncharacterized membrane protein YfcA
MTCVSAGPAGSNRKHWPTASHGALGGLAGGCTGARIQSRLPDALICRIVGILAIAIAARYLWSGLN